MQFGIRKFYTILEDGAASGRMAGVDTNNNLNVNTPYTNKDNVDIGGGDKAAGAIVLLSENNKGTKTGQRSVLAPETDSDFRLRVGIETQIDDETFNTLVQNTGKITYSNATMTASWSGAGLITNASGITTISTAMSVGSYAMYPLYGGGVLTYIQFKGSISAQPTSNTIIDIGAFLRGAANPFTPVDGVYFRLNSSGLLGVINHNGTENTIALPFVYNNNQCYQFLATIQEDKVRFWINDELYGEIQTPVGQGQPCMSGSLPFSIRHAIVGGAAGSVLQFTLRDYNISLGGVPFQRSLGEYGNACFGSYQGLSGGTMGSLANFANSANPAAAVPTNTTAALGTGLGGQFWETDTLAVTTDGVIMSYQVPAGTVNLNGRRLKLSGVKIDSFVQTTLTGGGYNAVWSLAFGHTAVSLATTEGAASKASRRIPIGVNSVGAAAAALTQLTTIQYTFQNPIYVNPGEFIALVKKKVGTAPSAGVIAHIITLDYSWE